MRHDGRVACGASGRGCMYGAWLCAVCVQQAPAASRAPVSTLQWRRGQCAYKAGRPAGAAPALYTHGQRQRPAAGPQKAKSCRLRARAKRAGLKGRKGARGAQAKEKRPACGPQYRRCKGSDEGLPEKAEGRAPFQGARLPPGRRREKPMQRRSMRFYPSISERSKSSGSSSERSAASSAAVRRAAARMASSSLLRARRPLPACRARASCTALK